MTVSDQILELYKEGKISEATAFKLAVFKSELIEKVAAAPKPLNFGAGMRAALPGAVTGLMIGGALAAGQGLANLTSKGVKKVTIKYENQAKFEAMLRAHPDLMSSDPEAVKSLFQTLVRFAPSFAADPAAAGAYIKRVIKFDPEGGSDYNTIATLVKLEKDHKDVKKSDKGDQLMLGMGSKVLKSTIEGVDQKALGTAFNI
jgi:hypothetical protein